MRNHHITVAILALSVIAACGGNKVGPATLDTTTSPSTDSGSSGDPPSVASAKSPAKIPLVKLDLTGLTRIEAARQRGEEISLCDFGPNIEIVTPGDQLCFRGVWTHIDLEFNGKHRMTLTGRVFDFYGERVNGRIVDFFKEKKPRKYTLFMNLLSEAVEVDKTIDKLEPLKFRGILHGPKGAKAASEFTNQPFTVMVLGIFSCNAKNVCHLFKISKDVNQTFWVKGDARAFRAMWPYEHRDTGGQKWGNPKKMADGSLYTPMKLRPPKDLAPGDYHIWLMDATTHRIPADFILRYRKGK